MMGYVKQANIAHGHQQVNNVKRDFEGASHARETANLQNELFENSDGERLDAGA